MATTTIAVSSDTKLRLDYYKSVFNYTNFDELLTWILNKCELASAEDIRRLRQMQHQE